MAKLAAVLVRSRIGARHDVVRALDALGLRKRHACAVLDDNPVSRGQMAKCKDFIFYGPVSDEMAKKLLAKKNTASETVVRLAPPRGGYPYRGIKVSHQEGGALGLRSESMDAFLERMV